MSEIASLGRPPDRSQNLLRELRARITRGDLPPGAQLPTRLELGQEFGVSSETVQRALSELRLDGFVTVRGRLGTFVAERPPHLTNYALVFPHPEKESSLFFSTLGQEAMRLADQSGRQVRLFFGIDKHRPTPEYDRLSADVKAHRIGGILFMSSPIEVAKTPLMDEPGIPRVAIMSSDEEYQLPFLYPDTDSFWTRATAHLQARGHNRIAFLLAAGWDDKMTPRRQQLLDAGFEVPRKWAHQVSRHTPEATAHLMELLFEQRSAMPEALVIADDNLLEAALRGIQTSGVDASDLEIVAHCNYPNPPHVQVPVTFLGFDCRQLIASCFDCIEKLRAGVPVAKRQSFPAFFEAEIQVIP